MDERAGWTSGAFEIDPIKLDYQLLRVGMSATPSISITER